MPQWPELWQQIVGVLREHAVKLVTGFVLMAVGWYIGKRRATVHWKKQEFFDRLNVSLNTIDGGTLKRHPQWFMEVERCV